MAVVNFKGTWKAATQPDSGISTVKKTLSQLTCNGQFHAVMRVSVTCGCAAIVREAISLPERVREWTRRMSNLSHQREKGKAENGKSGQKGRLRQLLHSIPKPPRWAARAFKDIISHRPSAVFLSQLMLPESDITNDCLAIRPTKVVDGWRPARRVGESCGVRLVEAGKHWGWQVRGQATCPQRLLRSHTIRTPL